MLKGSTTVIQYLDIDYEIVELIKYINMFDGIETVESCCGHGEMPCQIWFKADSLEYVTRFIYKYLYRNPNWRVVINPTDKDFDEWEWANPTYLLETTFPDYYYTGLAIDNLTFKLKGIINAE